MGYNFIVEDAGEAFDFVESNGQLTTVPVEGGYMILEWSDYYRRIREEAESLYDGGWRASDPDIIESLIREYCDEDNIITREWAGGIVSALCAIKAENKGYADHLVED